MPPANDRAGQKTASPAGQESILPRAFRKQYRARPFAHPRDSELSCQSLRHHGSEEYAARWSIAHALMRASRERGRPQRVKECGRQHPSPYPRSWRRLFGATVSRRWPPFFEPNPIRKGRQKTPARNYGEVLAFERMTLFAVPPWSRRV